MSVQIRIKVRGKWYKALNTGYALDTCDKCALRRICSNTLSDDGDRIRSICKSGFKEIKEVPLKHELRKDMNNLEKEQTNE